jgi:excisionase family DNA binding protein
MSENADTAKGEFSKNVKDDDDEMLTLPAASELVGRHQHTLRRWIYSGYLPAQKGFGKQGRFRVKKSDLMEAVKYEPVSNQKSP